MGKYQQNRRLQCSCPIHKKENKQDCNNYRGIALLNVTHKVFSNCILSRLKSKAEETIGDYQGGFRLGRLIVDQIFILRQLFQKIWLFDKEIYVLFIDFKKAYNSIHRNPNLINCLKEFKLPQKLI